MQSLNIEIHYVKTSQNDDHTCHINSKLRELDQLLLKMKEKNLVTCLRNILQLKLFREVVKSVLELCGWNEKEKTIETPSLGIKLGITLGKISYLIRDEAIIENDSIIPKNSDDFYALV